MAEQIKILLLNPPYHDIIVRDNYCCHTSKGTYIWAPSDLLYASGILNVEGIELKALDAVVERKSPAKVKEEIRAFQPDIIVTLTGTLSLEEDMVLLEEVHQELGNKNYVMGNYPAFNSKDVLERFSFVDAVFHNFFDTAILDFIQGKEQGYKSVSYRTAEGDLHQGSINYLKKGDKPTPGAPRFDLFPNHLYTTPISYKKPIATVITAFGCPYTCKFCVASSLNFYFRPLENLEKEFDAMKEAGIKEIFFMDSTFNTSMAMLRDVCKLMIEKDYKFSWSCNIHSLNFSREDFALMKKAGCHTIQIGVESGSQETRDEFAPTKSEQKLKDVFAMSHAAGIRTLGYFIIGFPNETEEDVLRTIDLAIELNPHFASFSTLMPDYGTKFYDEAISKNMIGEGFYAFDNSGKPLEMANFKLSTEDRERLRKLAFRKFYMRPKQLFKYVREVSQMPLYISNGLRLLKRYAT